MQKKVIYYFGGKAEFSAFITPVSISFRNHHQYNDLVLKNMSYYYLCWKLKTVVMLHIFVETTFF